jgi:hypothetical protein
MAGSLSRKVSVALLAVLVGTAAITGLFTYYKLHSVLDGLVQSRYGVQVFSIKRNVEDLLALGFPLRQLRPIQDVIEREKVGDDAIRGIEIFDATGKILFDTDLSAIGSQVPGPWIQAALGVQAAPGGGIRPFIASDDDDRIVGLPLIDNLGQVDGGIILRYPVDYLERSLGPTVARLITQSARVLVVFGLIAVIGSHLLIRSVGRRLHTMEAALAKVMEQGGAAVPENADDSFEAGFAAFAAKSRETVDDMRESWQDVERLDRLV